MPRRLASWWRTLEDGERRHASILAMVGLGYVVHYLVYCWPQPFFIEDAGISFAYARNLIDGEGLVTFPGGERVEGYSNALWTFLLAAFYALGVPFWTSAKVMGAVFGLMTLPLAYGLVKRARPGAQDDVALLAPVMLAASPQFVIWNSSGLENSLFCLLLAAGTWRLVVEMQSERDGGRAGFPWSAVFYVLLCMTRPEGLMYAGIGLFGRALGSAAVRRPMPLLAWLAVFAVPLGLYNLWRYWYFAWPFPNTYYAKLGKGTSFRPFSWTGGGWKYVKNWFLQHSVVYMLPLLGLAMTGFRRWRRGVMLLLLVAVTLVLLWDGRAGIDSFEPSWWIPVRRKWVDIRVWTLAGSCLALGVATLGTPGWRARGLLWTNACAGVFFALYSGGDWMKAHRWFNLVSVSLFPVIAIGLGELLDALPGMAARLRAPSGPAFLRRGVSLRFLLALLAGGYWVAQEGWHSNAFANNPETSVRDVHRRVRYMKWVQRQLDLDEVVLLDVDMGAHMFFTEWGIADIAGLVDVTMAHHRNYPKAFVREYVFEERNPDFAHVHGGWARSSKINTHQEWKDRYLEIPGYPIGAQKLHVGNHIRRDLFITEVDGALPPSAQRFEGDVALTAFEIPAPEVAAGELLYVNTAWRAGLGEAFEALIFLDDGAGHRSVQAMEPGYGWYASEEWKPTEEVASRFRVALPEDLPEGRYNVGVVLIDSKKGSVLAHKGGTSAAQEADAATGDPLEGATPGGEAPVLVHGGAPVMLSGEWLTGLVVEVVSPEQAYVAAKIDAQAALALAEADACDEVWPRFKDATRHVLRDEDWRAAEEPAVRSALADCYVRRASQTPGREARGAVLVEARRWDRHLPALKAAARLLASELSAEGDGLAAAEDWEGAYADYRLALQLDPRLSWVRRRAEEARDHRLGLTEVEEDQDDDEEEEGDDGAGGGGDGDDEEVPRSVKPARAPASKSKVGKRPTPRKDLTEGKAGKSGGGSMDKGYIDGRGTPPTPPGGGAPPQPAGAAPPRGGPAPIVPGQVPGSQGAISPGPIVPLGPQAPQGSNQPPPQGPR